MQPTEHQLHEMLTKLVRLATYLLDHEGSFNHAQTELEYLELRKTLPVGLDGELGAELSTLLRRMESVVSNDGGDADRVARLSAARDRAIVLLARDEYQHLR